MTPTTVLSILLLVSVVFNLHCAYLYRRARADNQKALERGVAMLQESTRRMREAEQHYLEMVRKHHLPTSVTHGVSHWVATGRLPPDRQSTKS